MLITKEDWLKDTVWRETHLTRKNWLKGSARTEKAVLKRELSHRLIGLSRFDTSNSFHLIRKNP